MSMFGRSILKGSDGKGYYFGDVMTTLVNAMKSCNKAGEVKNNYINRFVRTVSSERIGEDRKKMYVTVSTSITPHNKRRIELSAKDSGGRNIENFPSMSWIEDR